jgi:hypothetical protein
MATHTAAKKRRVEIQGHIYSHLMKLSNTSISIAQLKLQLKLSNLNGPVVDEEGDEGEAGKLPGTISELDLGLDSDSSDHRELVSLAVENMTARDHHLQVSRGSGLPTNSPYVGVKNIDEVYGRWEQHHKLLEERLDLEALFRNIRSLPPCTVSVAQGNFSAINNNISG